ncbi:MAG: AMIN domain-containing protein [Deltaproteobacteria bacterium]|nr:AMIN domain-containing protein [Deltaproteobacteria bacterium]
MLKRLIAILILVLLGLFSAQAATVRIKAVRADSENGGLVLFIDLTVELRPRVFTVDEKGLKPRVVMDFVGAKAGRLPARIASPSPLAKGIRVGRHPDKIRLVIDLEPGRVYQVEQWFRKDIKQYILLLSTPE